MRQGAPAAPVPRARLRALVALYRATQRQAARVLWLAVPLDAGAILYACTPFRAHGAA